jgi:hypothetical protein
MLNQVVPDDSKGRVAWKIKPQTQLKKNMPRKPKQAGKEIQLQVLTTVTQ